MIINNQQQKLCFTKSARMSARPQRKAAKQARKRMKSSSRSSQDILRGEIPYIRDAYKINCDGDPNVGDAEHGQIILASIPVPDDNGDYKSVAIFANEPDKIYEVKATNIMADDPAYLDHVKAKAAKYDFVKAAVKALEDDGDKTDKEKKSKMRKKKRDKKERSKRKNKAKIEDVCIIFYF